MYEGFIARASIDNYVNKAVMFVYMYVYFKVKGIIPSLNSFSFRKLFRNSYQLSIMRRK